MAKPDPRYVIELARLKAGRHSFDFPLDDALLEPPPGTPADAEGPPARNVQGTAHVVLDKSERLLDLAIALTATATLACDRCLADYPHPLQATYRLVYSHDRSVAAAEGEADVRYLPAGTPSLDLRQELYEALLLQVPQRRLPPDCPGPRCPAQVLALLEAGARAAEGPLPEDAPDPDSPDAPIDPRWSALRGLRPN